MNAIKAVGKEMGMPILKKVKACEWFIWLSVSMFGMRDHSSSE